MSNEHSKGRKVIGLYNSFEEETYKTESKLSLNEIVTQLEIMRLKYEKEKLHKEKLKLEKRALEEKLRITEASWGGMKDSFIVHQPAKEIYIYSSVQDYEQYFTRETMQQRETVSGIAEINQYRPLVLAIENEPRQQMEATLIRKPVVDLEIRDILLISFLYLAGLFFIGVGIMKPDIFYAALGALGIIGATFHWMKEQRAFD